MRRVRFRGSGILKRARAMVAWEAWLFHGLSRRVSSVGFVAVPAGWFGEAVRWVVRTNRLRSSVIEAFLFWGFVIAGGWRFGL